MTSEDILTELLIEARKDGDFDKVIAEVNKLQKTDITSTRIELFKKAIKNVRRNKTV
jgi:hypothetical protein